MFVVAITDLVTPLEAEAAALAADLGTTPYEQRIHLNAGLPAIVSTTADREAAVGLLRSIRARGHGAVAFDSSAVVASDAMVSMRRFVLEPDAITVADRPGERLPYSDILALLKAMHKTRTETHTQVTGKQFSMGRALMSGGVLLSKKVTRDQTSISEDGTVVLYVFRASSAKPWILRERGTQYTALGKQLAPSSMQNFTTTIAILREKAPQAVYDERLMNPRALASTFTRTVGLKAESLSASSASGVDLLAHLLALSIARGPAPARPPDRSS